MLEELRRYDNLGTPGYFWELFHLLREDNVWTEADISVYFFDKIIDNRNTFDGCIPLLKLSGIISINEYTKEIEVGFPYKNILHSEQLCQNRLLEGILSAFREDEEFYNIFSPEYSSYDLIYKAIQVDCNAFGLRYANIRKLLTDFDLFIPHPDFPQKKLIINSYWKKHFDQTFAPEIRKRKIGIEELRKKIEQQQINGEIGERFVMEFESARLEKRSGIDWISPYDTKAGYDILSFNGQDSAHNDRFIEVKSYAGNNPYFYWTLNEMSVARQHGKEYFIYLVDREMINNPDYAPIIISDPINNVMNSDKWIKSIDKYYIMTDETY